MNYRIVIVAFLIAGVASLGFAGGNKEESEAAERSGALESEAGDVPIAVEDAVARVDGSPISRDEFDRVMAGNIARFEQQNQQAFNEQYRPQLERQVLDGLITRALLEREAEKIGVEVSDEDIDAMRAQFKSQFPNESAYRMALEQEGFTEDEFVVELGRQMTIKALIEQEVYSGVSIKEESMRDFYKNNPQYFERAEQVSARHIILATEGITDEDELAAKRAELESIRQEIIDGADFSEVAQERSEGPSAANGGRLGRFARGQMVPAFDEVAFSLEPGEISEIVETQFGYHIVEVLEKTDGGAESYEAAKERIRTLLSEQERNAAAQHYLAGLRDEAEIVELIEIAFP